jgi:hypothetical protein
VRKAEEDIQDTASWGWFLYYTFLCVCDKCGSKAGVKSPSGTFQMSGTHWRDSQ